MIYNYKKYDHFILCEDKPTIKKVLFPILIVLLFYCNPSKAQMFMERLDRGVVAVNTAQGVFISWRMLGTEPDGVSYNIYRNGTKLNTAPITAGTNYLDNGGSTNAKYTVTAIINNAEQAQSVAASVLSQNYLSIPMQIPPASGTATYSVNDCSVGDVDGDGVYEIIVKWDPSDAKDNSQDGVTGNVYIDAYKLDGTRIWRIDMGRNIRAGAHYTQFLVYDFDSDGKAEMICKTADGTVDGKGTVIGSATADHRNSAGYVLAGPEFLTVFNGETGAAMATVNYAPARGTVNSWGDNYGNRVDRFVAVVAYLDGERPSAVMGRGYYTRLVRAAYDWKDGKLTQKWIFDSNASGNSAYAGQGNHNMTVGDVDGDGAQEIFNGSSGIDNTGTRFWANGLGHGDVIHMSDMDPDRPGLELWQPYEDPASNGNIGAALLDAKTGTQIFKISEPDADVGRAMAADIDPRHKGYEMWASRGNLYNCKGTSLGTSKPGMNFAVWWDGDLLRELLDGTTVSKWNHTNNTSSTLLNATGCSSNNGTKSTPALSADIFGDWREEVMLRTTDNKFLRIYTTTNSTTQRIRTLMHDPQYRVAIAWQNSAYNQPPHPGFYLGDGMTAPAAPNIKLTGNDVTGTTNSEDLKGLVYFPNPFSHNFTLSVQGKFSYEIIDLTGKVVESGMKENLTTAGELLHTGIYMIRVITETGVRTFKVTKN